MTIDDIDYLKENSYQDSSIIFIDSALRDYTLYPTPSDYSITFDQPFKNVYSIEIMDATIPTTMYNIDIYTQLMHITTFNVSSASITPIDPVEYANELSTNVAFSSIFENANTNFLIVCNEAQSLSYTLLPSTLNTNNKIAVRKVISNVLIIQLAHQSSEEYYFFTYIPPNTLNVETQFKNRNHYGILNIPSNQPIIDILSENNYYLTLNLDNTYNIIYYTYYNITENTYNIIKNSNNYIVNVNNYRFKMNPGNYQIDIFKEELNKIIKTTYEIECASIGGTDTIRGQFIFSSKQLFLINGNIRELDSVTGFDLMPSLLQPNLYKAFPIGNNNRVFMATFDDLTTDYSIIPPGMVNLAGPAYVILRCPEVEDQLYGSHAYTANCPGIGIMKFINQQSLITSLRWDFSTVNKKPIHPIGKLQKITFQFILPNGKLYDFKGINHQFIMAIKFYSPINHTKFKKSILNPNYNPNLIEYMAENKGIKHKEDSDNEVDFDNVKDYNYYKKELDTYGYSTDDEDEESESED
jgi:hypothetical protein